MKTISLTKLKPKNNLWPEHLQELEESGIKRHIASFAGVRSVTASEAKQLVGYSLPGLYFPYFDLAGQQYTYGPESKPYGRLKPLWGRCDAETKSYWEKDGKLPKYLAPKNSGSFPYIPRGLDWKKATSSGNVIITEGEKKALSGCSQGLQTLALSGVWSWRQDKELAPSIKALKLADWTCRKITLIFDSDITLNPDVKAAIKALTHAIISSSFKEEEKEDYPKKTVALGKKLSFSLLSNELDGSKNGLDDYLVRHGLDSVSELVTYSLPLASVEFKGGALDYSCLFVAEPCGTETRKELPKFNQRTLRSVMTAATLKGSVANCPGLGFRRYDPDTGIWKEIDEKDDFKLLPLQLCSANQWQNRSATLLAENLSELRSKAKRRKDDWDKPRYLAFTNGVLDRETGELLPFSPKYLLTKRLGFDYDPTAKCPTWLTFLESCFPKDSFNQKLLQALFRWTLEPKGNESFPVEVVPILQGAPGVGKGTTIDVLINLLGDSAATFDGETLERKEDRFDYLGKLAIVDTDFKGGLSSGCIGVLNKIASNEPVAIRPLYQQGSSVRLGLVSWFALNESPRLAQDAKDGFQRRAVTLKFRHRPAKKDPLLKQKLRRELAGIYNWVLSQAVDVAIDLIENSRTAESQIENQKELLAEQNTVYAWLIDQYPSGLSKFDAKSLHDLYLEYSVYTKEGGQHSLGKVNFGKDLSKAGAFSRTVKGKRSFYLPRSENLDILALLGTGQSRAKRVLTQLENVHSIDDWREATEKLTQDETDEIFGKLTQDDQEKIRQIYGSHSSKKTAEPAKPAEPSQPEQFGLLDPPKFKTGDSVIYIGPKENLQGLTLQVKSVQGQKLNGIQSDGKITTWLDLDEIIPAE